MELITGVPMELKGELPFYFKVSDNHFVKVVSEDISVITVSQNNPEGGIFGATLQTMKTEEVVNDLFFIKAAKQVTQEEFNKELEPIKQFLF